MEVQRSKRKVSDVDVEIRSTKRQSTKLLVSIKYNIIVWIPHWMDVYEDIIQDYERNVVILEERSREVMYVKKKAQDVLVSEYTIKLDDNVVLGPKGLTTLMLYIAGRDYLKHRLQMMVKVVEGTGRYYTMPLYDLVVITEEDQIGYNENSEMTQKQKHLLVNMINKINEWKAKGSEEFDYSLGDIVEVVFIIFSMPMVGGCGSNTSVINKFDMKLKSVQSIKNECLINTLCTVKKIQNRNHSISRDLRSKYPKIGEIGEGIAVADVPIVAEYFKLNVEVWDSNKVCLIKHIHDPNCSNVILVFHDKHYYLMLRSDLLPRVCPKCKRSYVRDHVCAIKTCENCGATYVRRHTVCDNSKKKYTYTRAIAKMDKNKLHPKFIASNRKWKNKTIIFDLETFPNELTGRHEPYAIGFMWADTEEYYHYWGQSCVSRFMDYIEKNFEQKKITLIGFNNCSFDNNFLFEELLNRNDRSVKFKLQNGSLISLECEKFLCRDLYRFLPGMSLAAASKSFGCPEDISKDKFPHLFIKNWSDLEYVGVTPTSEYYPGGYDGPISREWNLKEECLKYLERDVKSTHFVCEKVGDIINSSFGICWTDFITISQLGYEFWANTISIRNKLDKPAPISDYEIDYYVEIPKEPRKLDFIRRSVYGGWVSPIKREFESDQYEHIMNGEVNYDEVEDYITAVDIVSMYATCMRDGLYPEGPSEWCDNLVEINSYIRDCKFDLLPMGIYEIDYVPNKNLIVPVLPWKEFVETKVDGVVKPKGEMKWDLEDRSGVYTSVDIMNARNAGYFISVKRGLIWRNRKPLFKQYIAFTEAIKKEGTSEKNPAKKKMGKLAGNAVYGKQAQKVIVDEHEVYGRDESIDSMEKEGYRVEDIILLKDFILCKREKENIEGLIPKPLQNAAFILSYSRQMRNNYQRIIDPDFGTGNVEASLEATNYYGDTDSFHVRMTPSVRERLNPYMQEGVFGMLWNDYDEGAKIIKSIYMGPKTYAVHLLTNKNEKKWVMKCKGIPQKDVSIDMFLEASNGNPVVVEMKDRLMKSGFKQGRKNGMEVEPLGIYSCDMNRTLGKHEYTGRQFNEDGTSYPHGFELNFDLDIDFEI